jgi:hypothetical protein
MYTDQGNYSFAFSDSPPLFSKFSTMDCIASDAVEGFVARPSSDEIDQPSKTGDM